MDKLLVNTAAAKVYGARMIGISRQMQNVAQRVGTVQKSLTWNLPISAMITGELSITKAVIDVDSKQLHRAGETLQDVMERYEIAEKGNCFSVVFYNILKWLTQRYGGPLSGVASWLQDHGFGSVGPSVLTSIRNITSRLPLGLLLPLGAVGTISKFMLTDNTLKYGEYKDKSAIAKVKQKQIENQKLKEKYGDEKWYDKRGTILETKKQAKAEVSLLEDEASFKGENSQAKLSYKVASAEAHAELSAGMYVYTKDKNGKLQKIFSPGVAAEVGASACLLSSAASGRIGLGKDNNMLGAYGELKSSVLSAEAKAGVAINKNEVHASAKAEADLAKIEGSAGVSVLGTDIGVTGAVKVGVGAHADIGYTDGKLKVDVGAAIGVGVDVGFEVDVSGTIDAVTSAMGDVTSAISDGVNAVNKAIGDGIKDGFGKLASVFRF